VKKLVVAITDVLIVLQIFIVTELTKCHVPLEVFQLLVAPPVQRAWLDNGFLMSPMHAITVQPAGILLSTIVYAMRVHQTHIRKMQQEAAQIVPTGHFHGILAALAPIVRAEHTGRVVRVQIAHPGHFHRTEAAFAPLVRAEHTGRVVRVQIAHPGHFHRTEAPLAPLVRAEHTGRVVRVLTARRGRTLWGVWIAARSAREGHTRSRGAAHAPNAAPVP